MIGWVTAAVLAAMPLQPCESQGRQAECGTVSVAENRTTNAGRRIDLHVAVLRKVPGTSTADAVFLLAGGPGQAAGALTNYGADALAAADRDIVLVDARGAGKSNPLHCDFGGDDQHLADYLNDYLPLNAVAACREALASRADLTQYTTRAIVDDLEEVRKALGYEKIDLYGVSYGTRVAQEIMRRYPRRVRMAILSGVVPPSMIVPVPHALNGQRSLEAVLRLCEADAACRSAYPELRADYQAMLERVADGVTVLFEDSQTKQAARLQINRGLFGEAFRNFLYAPELYAQVPSIVHRGAQGDFGEFGQAALRYARWVRTLDFGMFLSVSCAEDFSRMNLAAAREESEGTLLGAYRVEQQVAACGTWPRGRADPAREAPLRSSIPTLLISGELDPVTPPKYAAEVAKTLSRSRLIIVPNGGHYGDTGGCVEKIMVAAVKSGAVRNLDVACLQRVAGPRFVTERPVS
jgi:pimeloyl-ACP methyl ester carboxylesterase